eukprot:9425491-Pyramimonas_sp.AAC.1
MWSSIRAVMIATALFRHSARRAPRPCQSHSRATRWAGFPPAAWHEHFDRFTGMRAHVVATCKYEPLGKRLERSNLRPKRQHLIRMTCRHKSSIASRVGPSFQK